MDSVVSAKPSFLRSLAFPPLLVISVSCALPQTGNLVLSELHKYTHLHVDSVSSTGGPRICYWSSGGREWVVLQIASGKSGKASLS